MRLLFALVVLLLASCGTDQAKKEVPTKKATPKAETSPPKVEEGAVAESSKPSQYRPVSLLPFPQQQAIDRAVRKAQTGKKARIPGAVVLVGRRDSILFHREYGNRAVVPDVEAMTLDTIFDVASMTKAVVTSIATMQLVEKGDLALATLVHTVLPEFSGPGKDGVTVEDLLRHRSGLPAANPLTDFDISDRKKSIRRVLQTSLKERGEKYSDVGFIVLGELVERVAKMPLDKYAQTYIFEPAGMRDTGFLPSADSLMRVAPTEANSRRQQEPIRGQVHDPRAFRLGGVSGNAGLFSTSSDLGRLAQSLLHFGKSGKSRILTKQSVEHLFVGSGRGLGWQLGRPEFSNRSMGHGGYTGTFFWVDFEKDLFVVILTNRVHPTGVPPMNELRHDICEAAVAGADKVMPGGTREEAAFGIDVLEARDFAALRGKRVGLITNQSGRTRDGRRTLDLLAAEPSVDVIRVFGPEHGIDGDKEGSVADGRDAVTGVPIVSVFGKGKRRPKKQLLEDLDVLVFDIQDVGVRFYTYVSTMKEAMKAAAAQSLPFVVLDRPNPLGDRVEGTLLEDRYRSFVNHYPLPVRHGMTVGELAKMFVAELPELRELSLRVIPMDARATATWDELLLTWIPPSPNLKTVNQVMLYPGTALVESANVSVGRGTHRPFEVVGAPYIDSAKLLGTLNAMSLPGLTFEETHFRPTTAMFRGQTCHGVRISIVSRETYRAFPLGLALAHALAGFSTFQTEKVARMLADKGLVNALPTGLTATLRSRIHLAEGHFLRRRKPFLLYSRSEPTP